MGDTSPPRLLTAQESKHREVEAAIKLLQSSGYEVFQRAAVVNVAVATSTDALWQTRLQDDASYIEHMRREHARKIGLHMLEGQLLAFDTRVMKRRPDDTWPDFTVHTSTLSLYPSARKEWLRQ